MTSSAVTALQVPRLAFSAIIIGRSCRLGAADMSSAHHLAASASARETPHMCGLAAGPALATWCGRRRGLQRQTTRL